MINTKPPDNLVTRILPVLTNLKRTLKNYIEIEKWKQKGRPVPPPPAFKVKMVKKYAQQHSTPVFVETGTYQGNMVFAVKDIFSEIYSIELDSDLYKKAKLRFTRYSHIHIHHGDSGKILPRVLADIDQPCLFWLDGHYSAGITAKGELNTPIRKELDSILKRQVKNDVVLIDDARVFTGKDDYPTIEELKSLVAKTRPQWSFEVIDDIIAIGNRPQSVDD